MPFGCADEEALQCEISSLAAAKTADETVAAAFQSAAAAASSDVGVAGAAGATASDMLSAFSTDADAATGHSPSKRRRLEAMEGGASAKKPTVPRATIAHQVI